MDRLTPIRQAVILAGGPGLRLRPLTLDRPKPLVLVNGRPFLEYLFDILKQNGIEEVVLLLGYLAEKITDYVGDGSKFGLRVKYSIGKMSDGTGTRIRNAKDLLHDAFLLLYCDNYLQLDLRALWEFHARNPVLTTVTVYGNKDNFTKNNMFVDEHGFVTKYDKSRRDPDMNGVDLGFFIVKKDVVELMPKDENFFFEERIIPLLISKRQLTGFVTDRPYLSTGTPERLHITEKSLAPKKVAFLDRDGVINKKPPPGDYVKRWEEFEFLPGSIEALKLLKENGYKIHIISNQAGIGRGLMSEETLVDIHFKMEEELRTHGVSLDAIYYCPHAPDAGCECRKPKPGLLIRAARDHFINLADGVFIGDDERDVAAGEAAGCKTILLKPEEGLLAAVKNILLS